MSPKNTLLHVDNNAENEYIILYYFYLVGKFKFLFHFRFIELIDMEEIMVMGRFFSNHAQECAKGSKKNISLEVRETDKPAKYVALVAPFVRQCLQVSYGSICPVHRP